MPRDTNPTVAISPAWFHILLALAAEERHGYALMQDVIEASNGEVKLGPGTLYGALRRLLELGFVAESPRRPNSDEDARRRYYRITPLGRRALSAEVARHARLVELARARRVFPKPRMA